MEMPAQDDTGIGSILNMKAFDDVTRYLSGKDPSRMRYNPSHNLTPGIWTGNGRIHESFDGVYAVRPPAGIPGSSEIRLPDFHKNHLPSIDDRRFRDLTDFRP